MFAEHDLPPPLETMEQTTFHRGVAQKLEIGFELPKCPMFLCCKLLGQVAASGVMEKLLKFTVVPVVDAQEEDPPRTQCSIFMPLLWQLANMAAPPPRSNIAAPILVSAAPCGKYKYWWLPEVIAWSAMWNLFAQARDFDADTTLLLFTWWLGTLGVYPQTYMTTYT